MSARVNIIAVENLPLVMEGLAGVLARTNIRFHLSFAESIDDAELLFLKQKCQIIIANPSFFMNNPRSLNLTKAKFDTAKWVALVFEWHNPNIISLFDAQITAADSPKSIEIILKKLLEEENDPDQSISQEILSGREIDVLKLLATGLTNKEIADQLNISIHTVISHRKNISQKTGIKSVSGLTIYAVTQKLLSIDSIRE